MSVVARFKVDKITKAKAAKEGENGGSATVTLSAVDGSNINAEKHAFADKASGSITLTGVKAEQFSEGQEFNVVFQRV